MAAVPLHAAAVQQVGAAAGNDVAAAHVHGNAHHAVRRHATAGGGHHRGDVGSSGLRVKIGPPAALSVQLGVRVVGVGRSAADRSMRLASGAF